MTLSMLRCIRGGIVLVLLACPAFTLIGCEGGGEPAPAPADPENDPDIESAMEGTTDPDDVGSDIDAPT